MTKKKKPAKKNINKKPKEISKADKDNSYQLAATALRPTVQAAVTLREYGKGLGELEIPALVKDLSQNAQLINEGDLKRGEAMLTAQAHTLDSIFNTLARLAVNTEYIDNLDKYLKLALRAQSQCRSTWEALGELKNPRSVNFVNQANISQGHQQVNNGTPTQNAPPHARENKKSQNKLLEKKDGERLDPRTTCKAGQNDPAMATVERVNGAKNS